MAEFKSSTFGTISGRHGSAVATTTKGGKSILRIFRQSVDAKTDKQMAQRTKFTFLIAFLGCMRELLNITFKGKGGFNRAFALAMKNAITGVAPNFSIDFSQLVFSEGSVTRAQEVTATKTADYTVKVNWNVSNISDLVSGGAKANEGVNLIFYNDATKEAMLTENVAIRIVGTAEVVCPDYWAGETIHCWIYFNRADGKLNSTSEYIGTVTL